MKPKGIWDDNIHLSVRSASFSAYGDSINIRTGGSWWWISDVSVDGRWFYNFDSINREAEKYTIRDDCFVVEHRDNHTLFIKVAPNPGKTPRKITVGLEAGDYFDRVIILQKAY